MLTIKYAILLALRVGTFLEEKEEKENIRKFSFSTRAVNIWKSLPNSVVDLDKFWLHPVAYAGLKRGDATMDLNRYICRASDIVCGISLFNDFK